MLTMDKEGLIQHPKIKRQIVPGLARGKLAVVHGIVVHQTGGSTAAAAFAGYKARPYGTHFLIDKDASIYQNASLLFTRRTLVRSRRDAWQKARVRPWR